MAKLADRIVRLEARAPRASSAEQDAIWERAVAELNAVAARIAAQATNTILVKGDCLHASV